MKKTYIKPVSETVALNVESHLLVGSSLDWNKDETVGGSQALSNRRNGWNSADWSQAPEAEE